MEKANGTIPDGMKPVLVTTQHRGVFGGLIPVGQDLSVKTMALQSARMAVRFGTDRGVMQLCESGPTDKSLISAPADIPALHDITAVMDITPDAWQAWQRR